MKSLWIFIQELSHKEIGYNYRLSNILAGIGGRSLKFYRKELIERD